MFLKKYKAKPHFDLTKLSGCIIFLTMHPLVNFLYYFVKFMPNLSSKPIIETTTS